MPATRLRTAARRLAGPPPDPASDAGLVERFAVTRDGDAFAELVRRHGPMVYAVTRRALRNPADADDAFQATFLVLAAKADSGTVRGPVANWLYGVAVRTAANARRAAARRSARVSGGTDVATLPAPPAADPADADLAARLDAELANLPEKYRVAVVLCELEGRSLKDAAEALGVPPGTVASRLARGRDLLAARLRKSVPAASAAGLAAAFADSVAARVPAPLLSLTAASALDPALVSEPVSLLIRKVSREMFVSKLRSAAVTAVAVLTVCGAAAVALSADAPPPPAPAAKRAPLPEFAGKPADAGKQIADANTAFGLDLYAKLIADKENAGKNVFISPFSVSAALAMTAAGASGKGFDEMQKVLHLPNDESATDAGFKHLFAKINDADTPRDKRGYQLDVANAIWAQKGEPWAEAFLGRVNGAYGAGILDADFKADHEKERLRINGWVEDRTNNKIKDLLPPPSVTPDTRMVLTNAVSFKGDWDVAFDKKQTRDWPFKRSDGTNTKSATMFRTGEYRLHIAPDFRALELPYKVGHLAMVVVLPKTADGLPAVEKSLTPATFGATLTALRDARPEKVSVGLPKFRFDARYDLLNGGRSALLDLGMKSVCAPGSLNRLTDSPNNLFVSKVVHKTFVDVNEEGTEAAGATAVVLEPGSAPRPNPEFHADHPFVFAIVHKPTNTVLFLGRVEDPTAK